MATEISNRAKISMKDQLVREFVTPLTPVEAALAQFDTLRESLDEDNREILDQAVTNGTFDMHIDVSHSKRVALKVAQTVEQSGGAEALKKTLGL